jgi:hypothetical protein
MAWMRPKVKVKLGHKKFDVNSEKIDASDYEVSDADCVAFAARMRTGEISRGEDTEPCEIYCFHRCA